MRKRGGERREEGKREEARGEVGRRKEKGISEGRY